MRKLKGYKRTLKKVKTLGPRSRTGPAVLAIISHDYSEYYVCLFSPFFITSTSTTDISVAA